MLKSLAQQVKMNTGKSLNRLIAVVFIATQILTPVLMAQPVLADGNGSPVECESNPNDNPSASNVLGSQSGTDDQIVVDAGAGNVADGVCIKSGSGTFEGETHSGLLDNGTYDFNGLMVGDDCYQVEGVGTQEVTVTRLEDNNQCKGLSHIDVVVKADERIDYCDPSQKPGGTSIDEWVPKDVNCVVPDTQLECGSFTGNVASEITASWGDNYGIAWSEGSPDYSEPFNDLPATFPEDYNGDSVDIYWFIHGPEAGYVQGHNLPNYWDESAKKVTVDTDCEEPEPTTGDIQVRKFNDRNGDGKMDNGEELLKDWDINLYKYENDEWDHEDSIETSASDFVTFTDLEFGTYLVCEEEQEDWEQTRPAADKGTNSILNESGDDSEADWCYKRVLNKDNTERIATFGNHHEDGDELGKIRVKKFEDKDEDGQFNNDDELEGGWEILLYDENWEPYPDNLDNDLSTDDEDWESFDNLPAGTYYVCEETELDWIQTFPTSETAGAIQNESDEFDEGDEEEWCWKVELEGNQVVERKFGNHNESPGGGGGGDRKADVIVIKYHDKNQNGKRDNNEPTLSDWTFDLQCGLVEFARYATLEELVSCDNHVATTNQDGVAEFEDIESNTYLLSERLLAGWNFSNIDCSYEDGSEGYSNDRNSHLVFLEPGSEVTCEVGNFRDAKLEIDKTNDATDTQLPGTDVEYTITVTNPEDSAPLMGTVVQDVLPAGFEYIGPFTVHSNGADITGDVTFSGYNALNVATWNVGDMEIGEVITITYTVEIGDDVAPGTYENIAFVKAFDQRENKVIGKDVSEGDKFAESEVTVGEVLGVTRQPEVLAVTGTGIVPSMATGSLITLLAGLMALPRKALRSLRRLLRGFKQSFGMVALAIAFTAMSILPAFAVTHHTSDDGSWTLRVADLAPTIRTDSVDLVYTIATHEDGNEFDVTLVVDGPADDTQGTNQTGSGSNAFTVDLPQDGNYVLSITAEHEGEALTDSQEVTVDTDGTAAGNSNGNGTSTGIGGFGGGGVVALDSRGVVSDQAATDSNLAQGDDEGDEQAATDDQTNGEDGENGENGEDDGDEDNGDDIWTTILIIGGLGLLGYYAYNWWQAREQ